MTPGEKIVKLAKKKGYSVRKLAALAGVNYSTLYSVTRRNSSFINADMLINVAKALDVPPEVLVDDEADVQMKKYTPAERLLINTIRNIIGTHSGEDRENYLYLINAFVEANQALFDKYGGLKWNNQHNSQ